MTSMCSNVFVCAGNASQSTTRLLDYLFFAFIDQGSGDQIRIVNGAVRIFDFIYIQHVSGVDVTLRNIGKNAKNQKKIVYKNSPKVDELLSL